MRLIITFLFIFFYLITFAQNNSVVIGKTVITPHLKSEIKKDTNIVYCSTFQIAWNELKRVVGDKIILDNNFSLVSFLNEGIDAEKYISKKDYAVFSGMATPDYIKSINRTLKSKFNDVFSSITDSPSPNDFIIYSFLYKKLRFKREFEDFKGDFIFSQNRTIDLKNIKKYKAFGVNSFFIDKNSDIERKRKKLIKQIDAYILPEINDQFIIRITTKEKDEIILSTIKPGKILEDNLDTINKYLDKLIPAIDYKICGLAIPEIALDFNVDYNELIGRTIKNPKLSIPAIIKEAKQDILFKIDKQGAILRSSAKIKTSKSAQFDPKYGCICLKFDEPFFLILKKHNEFYPYFILWIANDNLFIRKE